MNIPYNIPHVIGSEIHEISKAISARRLCGGGAFGAACEQKLEALYPGARALLTTSCTDALEMCAALLNISPGDEVLMPSYTFVSSANPFVIRGASVKFLDIEYPTMNVSSLTIANAITEATKAVVVVNYGGGSADLAAIRALCDRKGIFMIEDAAQSILSTYAGLPIGSFGHLACLSFHETKNIHCGEGGALLINDHSYFERAEILREKGTDRGKFFRGEVDKYSWVDIGSSHIPSELNSAFLSVQLDHATEITQERLRIWRRYKEIFKDAEVDYLHFSPEVQQNAHIFGIFAPDLPKRSAIILAMKQAGIQCSFHYVPLHSSKKGRDSGVFHGADHNTTQLSDRLIRLPLYPALTLSDVDDIAQKILQALRS